jgi:hypothetical protein
MGVEIFIAFSYAKNFDVVWEFLNEFSMKIPKLSFLLILMSQETTFYRT